MFTGIVQAQGRVRALHEQPGLRRLTLEFPAGFAEGLMVGGSVAVDGVCLTVSALHTGDAADFEVMLQSLEVTTLGRLQPGSRVNLERAARDGAEIGGHALSGHVDFAAKLAEIRRPVNNTVWRVEVPAPWMRYVFPKGYIAVNGASLTVSDITRAQDGSGGFEIWLIPETLRVTNFAEQREGAWLNIEIERQTRVLVDTVRDVIREVLDERLAAAPLPVASAQGTRRET
jgi:riboflavin synthase